MAMILPTWHRMSPKPYASQHQVPPRQHKGLQVSGLFMLLAQVSGQLSPAPGAGQASKQAENETRGSGVRKDDKRSEWAEFGVTHPGLTSWVRPDAKGLETCVSQRRPRGEEGKGGFKLPFFWDAGTPCPKHHIQTNKALPMKQSIKNRCHVKRDGRLSSAQ